MSSDTQPTSDPTSAPTESRRIVVEYYGTRYTVTVYPAGPDWPDTCLIWLDYGARNPRVVLLEHRDVAADRTITWTTLAKQLGVLVGDAPGIRTGVRRAWGYR